ncbi:unnamed protein product [Prunus armeniaca]|uniref:Uncharacterized protein n=1 Tax=Prunus armeniaca TaxID=36596 RepID=A0A6J5XCY5_PRUAR|nr:unnamed protein product [Prunus armeniaca]CAB4309785.1 unnamed protein product [Prunus armeniaca]
MSSTIAFHISSAASPSSSSCTYFIISCGNKASDFIMPMPPLKLPPHPAAAVAFTSSKSFSTT